MNIELIRKKNKIFRRKFKVDFFKYNNNEYI